MSDDQDKGTLKTSLDGVGVKFAIFTACSVNYLGKAVAMCQSALDHHPDAVFFILLVDKKRKIEIVDSFVNVVWAEDVSYPEYLQCAFKYNIIELNTALKPFFACKLLNEYSKVVYLDPDVCVFSPLVSVLESLDDHSSLFTPHALSPYVGAGRPNDQDLLRFGCFNLGFFAVKDTVHARALLTWWHEQCLSNCFYEPQVGLGVDQKWIDLAPAFFDEVEISKDIGLNVAFWNLHERQLKKTPDGWVVNGTIPLGFVHFSSFDELDKTVIADKQTRHAPGTREDFSEVGDVYRKYLSIARERIIIEHSEYGYAKFEDGSSISPALRRFYACYKKQEFQDCINPFAVPGVVYAFAGKHYLRSSASIVVAHDNFKKISSYSKERRLIAFVFRFILRMIGPDRYFSFV